MHEVIACGDIMVSKVGVQDNPIDIMTKSLSIAKFVRCSNLVGLGCFVFCLWGFIVEGDYGFDLVLRYEIC